MGTSMYSSSEAWITTWAYDLHLKWLMRQYCRAEPLPVGLIGLSAGVRELLDSVRDTCWVCQELYT